LDQKKENILVYTLIGILIIGAIFFTNTEKSTGQAAQYCLDGDCGPTGGGGCTSECYSGRRCATFTSYQVCGNYDPDSCLEWGATTSCGTNEECLNGYCQQRCTNECSQSGSRECFEGGYRTCGNFDSDSCLEWSEGISLCPEGQICSNGQCITQCTDTDGGLNYFVKGTVTIANATTNATFTDYCTDRNIYLMEGYCSGDGNLAVTGINCSYYYAGRICSDGACINQTGPGSAYFTSNPTGALVQYQAGTSPWSTVGTTPVTKFFSPGTYRARAIKEPFYQIYTYTSFTVYSGHQTNVNFVLNQTHHSACNPYPNGTSICGLVSGPGTIACTNIGGSCTPY